MKHTWILVANASHARCFERLGATASLELLSSFECPQARYKGVDLETDRSGYEEMGHGRGSTSFSERVGPRAKVREEFARGLAQFLNAGIAAQRCSALVVLASSPFLGRVKAHLSQQAKKMLTAAIGRDLTGLDSVALAQRIRDEVPRIALH